MISTPYALAFLALQMRRPDMRLTLNLRDDKPAVSAYGIIHYTNARRAHEKAPERWWVSAERILKEAAK